MAGDPYAQNRVDAIRKFRAEGYRLVHAEVPSTTDRPVSLVEAINFLLHHSFGADPCSTGCTHVVHGQWTALGIANVIGRAEERSQAREQRRGPDGRYPPPDADPWPEEGVSLAGVAAGPQATPGQVLGEIEGTVRHTYATGYEAHRCSCCPGLHVEARHIEGIEGAARCDWLYDQFHTLPEGTRLLLRVVAVPTDPEDPTDE